MRFSTKQSSSIAAVLLVGLGVGLFWMSREGDSALISTGEKIPDGSQHVSPHEAVHAPIRADHVGPLTANEVTQNDLSDTPRKRPLAERMRFDTEGLEVVLHPDGRMSAHLEGRFLHMATKTQDEEGHSVVTCTTDHDHVIAPSSSSTPRHVTQTAQIR